MTAAKASSLAHRFDEARGRSLDVLGIGEAGLDEVYRVRTALSPGAKLPAERMLLGGGQVATALVACARLGKACAFGGAVFAEGARKMRAEPVRIVAENRRGRARCARPRIAECACVALRTGRDRGLGERCPRRYGPSQ